MAKVSITNFRDNLSSYLRLVKYKGETFKIVDEKLGEAMAELKPTERDGWDDYLRMVESMYGLWKKLPVDKIRKRVKEAGIGKLKRLKSV